MLEFLTKPIIIGSISIPLLLLIIIVICILTLVSILYFYLKESEKSLSPKKENLKQNETEEEKNEEKKFKQNLKKLKRSLPYLNKKEANEKFIVLLRAFFKKLLEIDYEFTFEELSEELEKKGRHEEIIEFCNEISNYKYKKGAIPKKQLLKFMKKLNAIIEYETIPEVNKIEKNSFFKKLRKPFIPHIRKPPINNKEENRENNQQS